MTRCILRSVLRLALLIAAIGCAASAQTAPAHNATDDPAFARAAHLQHGINTSLWFAQSRDYSVDRLRSFTTADDIALIERLGFDHVRLSIDPVPLLASGLTGRDHSNPGFLTELDRVVHLMLEHHLAVIIDIHPESPYKAALRSGDDSVGQFVQLWSALAAHFSSYDSEHVFFEIMNEPEQNDAYRWIGIESRVAEAIRAAAPRHTIIAAGAHYSGLPDLLETEPLPLGNVIYTFHDYEPFPFTHQGATWTDARVEPLRNVPYPSSPEAVAPLVSAAGTLRNGYFVEEYGLAHWDRERVERTLAFARRWADLHNVPVYCGEFGVLRTYADPKMRERWAHDMTDAMHKYRIGWAMWDYQDSFGVVTKKNGTTTPDAALLQALGLHAAP